MDRVTTISFFLILMVLLLPIVAKLLKGYTKFLLFGKYCILVLYLYVNLRLTLLGRNVYPNYILKEPFWSYVLAIHGSRGLMKEIILNILLYVPLGYLLRFTFSKIRPCQVILIGIISSVLTETIQLVFKIGFCEFDDVFSNTLGTVIGVSCYWGIKKLYKQPLELE